MVSQLPPVFLSLWFITVVSVFSETELICDCPFLRSFSTSVTLRINSKTFYRARAHCLTHTEASTMALAFKPVLWHWLLRKEKSFIAGRQEAKLICLPHPGFRTRLKGNRLVCGSAGGAVFHRRALEPGHLW